MSDPRDAVCTSTRISPWGHCMVLFRCCSGGIADCTKPREVAVYQDYVIYKTSLFATWQFRHTSFLVPPLRALLSYISYYPLWPGPGSQTGNGLVSLTGSPLQCLFLYKSDSKIKGLPYADSVVDALGIRKQWVLNENNNASKNLLHIVEYRGGQRLWRD